MQKQVEEWNPFKIKESNDVQVHFLDANPQQQSKQITVQEQRVKFLQIQQIKEKIQIPDDAKSPIICLHDGKILFDLKDSDFPYNLEIDGQLLLYEDQEPQDNEFLENFNCQIQQAPQIFYEDHTVINKTKIEEKHFQHYFKHQNKKVIVYFVGWIQAKDEKDVKKLNDFSLYLQDNKKVAFMFFNNKQSVISFFSHNQFEEYNSKFQEDQFQLKFLNHKDQIQTDNYQNFIKNNPILFMINSNKSLYIWSKYMVDVQRIQRNQFGDNTINSRIKKVEFDQEAQQIIEKYMNDNIKNKDQLEKYLQNLDENIQNQIKNIYNKKFNNKN